MQEMFYRIYRIYRGENQQTDPERLIKFFQRFDPEISARKATFYS